jgi:hypothetical protein
VTYGGGDYVFCDEAVLWTTARDDCASIGMHLVRVDDANENQFLFDNAPLYTASTRFVWFGGSDSAVEGEWRWLDGELFWLGDSAGSAPNGLFSNWYPTQPGNAPALDCMGIEVGQSTNWNSLACTGSWTFVCESP